jgi:serine/threonine protein kinase
MQLAISDGCIADISICFCVALLQFLGRGSFGTVYHAYWQGTPYAVKIVELSTDTQVDDYVQEGKQLLRCRHPHIVTVS